MAAGCSTFHIATPAGSLPKFLCSPFPVSSATISPRHVALSGSRVTASSTSLLASEIPRRESADFLKMESAFSSLFLSVEKSVDDWNADALDVNPVIRAPWHILEAVEEEHPEEGGGAFSPPLAWRDASLRYANVMWFKGSYNVEMLCREDEHEESIVRRFRRKALEAGVIQECHRRRYRETKQDTIKRKQRIASMNRKRKTSVNASNAWTQNAWKLSKDHLKPVDHSKKKKSSRKYSGQSRFDTAKKSGSDKKIDDMDDDYWGFVEDDEGPQGASRMSSQ